MSEDVSGSHRRIATLVQWRESRDAADTLQYRVVSFLLLPTLLASKGLSGQSVNSVETKNPEQSQTSRSGLCVWLLQLLVRVKCPFYTRMPWLTVQTLGREVEIGGRGKGDGYHLSEECFFTVSAATSERHHGPHLCGQPLAIFRALERQAVLQSQWKTRAAGRPLPSMPANDVSGAGCESRCLSGCSPRGA